MSQSTRLLLKHLESAAFYRLLGKNPKQTFKFVLIERHTKNSSLQGPVI